MKNSSKYSLLFLLILMVSCQHEKEKQKLTYDTTNKQKPAAKVDATQIKVADLPINFTGTTVLLHPVGDLNIYGRDNNLKYESSSRSEPQQSFTVSNNNEYEISGYLENIKFQEIGQDSIKALTDKSILIETATYLKTIADKTKKQLIVYTLSDTDTNKDGKVDSNDIKSIYISTVKGEKFTKLSNDLFELVDWNVIEAQNRIYFRTIEDINKNGAFDKDDKIHYYYLELLAKDWKAQEYFPIK